MALNIFHVFIFHLCILYILFGNIFLHVFGLLEIGLFVFSYSVFDNFLYMLDVSLLSHLWFVNIFPASLPPSHCDKSAEQMLYIGQ